MSTVNISKESVAGFNAGTGVVGTTAAVLAESYPVQKHVVVRAHAGNTGTISVAPTASAAGFVLAAGETSPAIYVDDVAKVWLTGSDVDQGYSWISS